MLNNSRRSNQRGRKGVNGVGGLLVDLAAPVAFGLPKHPRPVPLRGRGCGQLLTSAELPDGPIPGYERFVDPEAPDEDRATLLELRSGGQHTLFPPSTHPSGEAVEWEEEGEPRRLAGGEFAGAVGKLAAASLLREGRL